VIPIFGTGLTGLVATTVMKVSSETFYSALAIVIGTVLLLFGLATVDMDPVWGRRLNVIATIFVVVGTVYGYGATFEGYGHGHTGRSIIAIGALAVVFAFGIFLVHKARKKNASPRVNGVKQGTGQE
jgi:hypothetical protein